ncbi:hypothetical protein [Geodermatophilus amargosae]|uniref:hypothetical protein n=1 Tax=Geodermatophilus amargosae TaxID=1296565 RepID=UPI0034DF03FD
MRYLLDAAPRHPVFGVGAIRSNIQTLLDRLEQYEMHVTRRVALPLEDLAAEIDQDLEAHKEEEGWEKTRTLTPDEQKRLKKTASSVRTTMLAEAAGQIAYITRDKRYDVGRLLNDVPSLMAPGVYEGLPSLAKFDFEQAGRCIAFEMPTAAAFHSMRGTEAVLRDFYLRLVLQKRLKPPLMWFAMTEALNKRRSPPPEVLMNNLDNLRKSFRNPTQHPDKVYDIEEVQDLFALSIDVVNRMSKHLKECNR